MVYGVLGSLGSLGAISWWEGLLILWVWKRGLLVRAGGRVNICWVWLVGTVRHGGPIGRLGVGPIGLDEGRLLISDWLLFHRRVGRWGGSFGWARLFRLYGRSKDKERGIELVGLMFHHIHNVEGLRGRGFLLLALVLGLDGWAVGGGLFGCCWGVERGLNGVIGP